MGIIELLRRVGEDNVFVQNLIENTTNVRLKGRRESSITFVTGQQFLQPAHVMEPRTAPYVGLMLWLPADIVHQARTRGGDVLRCMDCGLPYGDFPLDMTLPDEQWQRIHEREGGVLCACCIVKRLAKLPGAIALRAHLEIARTNAETS